MQCRSLNHPDHETADAGSDMLTSASSPHCCFAVAIVVMENQRD
jgi:hypothetical protein